MKLSVASESWPIQGHFTISRSSLTSVELVVVTLEDKGLYGRGECRPYARYNESPASVLAEIDALRPAIEGPLDRAGLQRALHPGAARNALDCAYWDLAAKQSGKAVWQLAGLAAPTVATTAFTLSLDSPDKMAAAARQNAHRPLLKLKLSGQDDVARVAAVRQAAPDSRLIVDANEAWTVESYRTMAPEMARLRVSLIEQPLPAAADEGLRGLLRPVPLCADESCHASDSLARLVGLYDAVNLKLDKTGGLTEALLLVAEAKRLGLRLMIGCMVATSLAMAPAMLLAGDADFVDLDGPLLLAKDRPDGLQFAGSQIAPPTTALWG